MDFFDNPNWYLTKTLLSCFGAWPFQSTISRIVLRSVVFLLIVSILVPEVLRLYTMWGNVNIVIECASTVIMHIMTIINMLHCFISSGSERKLLMKIRNSWKLQSSIAEKKYLREFTSTNNRITVIYAVYIYGAAITYMTTPMIPKLLDYILPLNESRPTIFLYQTEYFVDPVKYETFILAHSLIVTPFPATIIVAFDALYANCAQHACCMFLILRNRMESLTKNTNDKFGNKDPMAKCESISFLTNCIEEHIRALEFSRDVQKIYRNVLFLILGINLVAISITGCHTVTKINEPSEAMRFGFYTIGQLIHLYFLSWPGQKLMDYSSSIFRSICQGNWYDFPMETRKHVILIMLRCSKPCTLKAGEMYIISMQSFSMVVKTSVSYLTVLTSMQ